MKGQKGEKQNLEIDVIFNREPVELPKNRNDMFHGGSSTNYMGQVKFMRTRERDKKGQNCKSQYGM